MNVVAAERKQKIKKHILVARQSLGTGINYAMDWQ
jgi:hypothetical protein